MLDCFAALLVAVGIATTWLQTVSETRTSPAMGLGIASILASIRRAAGAKRQAAPSERQAPDSAASPTPDSTPGIADRLKPQYGTRYPSFHTLDQIDKIMAERTRLFFGREDQLAALDAFVRDNPRGILVLAAPGGFGKSALLANWGRRREAAGADVAYHFFNATADHTTQRADALKGLLVQIAFLRGRRAPTLPDDPAKLDGLLTQELCQDSRRPLIVILDGLDEAAERFPPLAPRGLGRHVYLLVSGRAAPGENPEHLARWLAEIGRVGYPVLRHDMPELSVDGVLPWVRRLIPGLSADQADRLAQRLKDTSEGVPLFLQFIVADIRDRHVRGEPLGTIVESLEAMPAPFTDYAAQQLRAMREMQGPRSSAFGGDVARVFALLTLAKGALPLDELQGVLGARVDPWGFDPRIVRWFAGRGTGTDRAIAFLNPVLAAVFHKALGSMAETAGLLGEVQAQLVGYCRARWSKDSLYALINLPLHQVEAGQVGDAIATLTDLPFLRARLRHTAAAALIARTTQDFEAAKQEVETANKDAPLDLVEKIRAHRFFWGNYEHRLLAVVSGPERGSAPQILLQLLLDDPDTARWYASDHNTPWVLTAGGRAPPPQLRELKGHRGPVLGATELGDGRLLSWSRDGTLRLWSANGTALPDLKGHSRAINGAMGLRDGRLLSWSDDGTLRLWSSDGAALKELEGHRRAVTGALALDDRRLLSWSQDGTLRLWTPDGVAQPALRGHSDWVNGATALGDGRLLSWSEDGTLRLWDAEGAAIAELKPQGESLPIGPAIIGATQLADGRLLSWSRGGDGILRLWTPRGAPLAELKGHDNWVDGALELADGRLLSWSYDGTLRLWSANGVELATLVGHSAWVRGALELSDGRLLSWSEDGTLRLWSSDGAVLVELSDPSHLARGATALSDGRLLSWSSDGALRLWTSGGTKLADLKGHGGHVNGATALSDGRLLSWSADSTLRLWDASASGLVEPQSHSRPVWDALVLSDGRLLSWSEDGTLRLWKSDGTALAVLKGHEGWVRGALVLSNGNLLSWSDDPTLRLWTSEGAILTELKGHNGRVLGAFVLSNGRLLSWSADSTLRLWNSDGTPFTQLKGHSDSIEGAMELGDGRLLSWSQDGTLRLWAADGAFLSRWLWPHGGVKRAIPHPDHANVYWVLAGNDVLQVRHQPEGMVATEGEGHEIFLSYAREDAAIVRALADDLTAAGYPVWYDKNIAGGERFRERIDAQIDAAKAVVVLWSEDARRSGWVLYEAERANRQDKHIPLLVPPLQPGEVAPYSAFLNILPHTDLPALKVALARKGVNAR